MLIKLRSGMILPNIYKMYFKKEIIGRYNAFFFCNIFSSTVLDDVMLEIMLITDHVKSRLKSFQFKRR